MQHQSHHDERGDSVRTGKRGGQNDEAGDRGGNEAVEIGQEGLEGSFYVQAGPVGFGQHPHRHQIHDDSKDRDDQDGSALDGRRIEETVDGLHGNQGADTSKVMPLAAAERISARLNPKVQSRCPAAGVPPG
ncbi:UNVERIFIED_ORG: hypothetical protein ABIB19_001259 [Arthrobacter sp. UYEF10]